MKTNHISCFVAMFLQRPMLDTNIFNWPNLLQHTYRDTDTDD